MFCFFILNRGNAPYRQVHEEAEIILALLYKPVDPNASISSMGSEGGEVGGVPIPFSANEGSVRNLSSDGSTASSRFIQQTTDDRGEVTSVGYDPTMPAPKTPGMQPRGFGNDQPKGDDSAVDLTKRLLELAGHEIARGAGKVGSTVKTKANDYDYYNVLSYVGLGQSDSSTYQKSSGAPAVGGGAPVGWGSDGSGGTNGGVIQTQGGGGGSSYTSYYKPQQAPAPPSRGIPGSASAPPVPRQPPTTSAKRSTPALLIPSIAADASVSTEEKFIRDLTAPGGVVKTALPPAILVSFCDRFPDLDQQKVTKLVLQRLNASQWQVRLKGLMILEEIVSLSENLQVSCYFLLLPSFLLTKYIQTKDELQAMIATSPSFRKLLDSPHRSVRTKSNSVFLLLEEETRSLPVLEQEPEIERKNESEGGRASRAGEGGLIEGDQEIKGAEGGEIGAVQGGEGVAAEKKENEGIEGLFGGLSVKQQASQEPLIDLLGPSGPSDVFPASAPDPQPPATTASSPLWFDSLIVPTPATPTPTPAPTQHQIPTPTPEPTPHPFSVFAQPQTQTAPSALDDDFFSFIGK